VVLQEDDVPLQNHDSAGLSASIFDALPFPAYIVDDDVRVLAANPAAGQYLPGGAVMVLRQRGGEAMHCINSGSGCGKSAACRDCVIRTAVTFAISRGQPVRRRARLERAEGEGGNAEEVQALVTASPVVYDGCARALVFVENLTLLLALTDALPICMGCKKVRDDDLWLHMEAYFDSHLDLKFSHGLCPECSKRLYPDYDLPAR
jgi:PAS domain-containing protein